ncbi:MAG TPA: hypothetical protein VJU84_14335 [Pyrinomonadaceae bacterium]|nr:hypothetical protein [Pyrinomonadaceae bacterium]
MTRSISRAVLTTLALVLLFAGSFNLNRTSAQDLEVEAGGGGGGGGDCVTYCGCGGGGIVCCKIEYPNGPKVYCGQQNP